jgi:hypothetical protein
MDSFIGTGAHHSACHEDERGDGRTSTRVSQDYGISVLPKLDEVTLGAMSQDYSGCVTSLPH